MEATPAQFRVYASHVNMLAASLCFASMSTCVHWLGAHMHWSIVTFFRMFISLLLLLTLARMRGIPIIVFGPRALWVRSITGSVGMACNFYALTLLPVSDALAMLHTAPIWVALIRRVVYRDRLYAVDWLCVLGAVAGVLIAEGASFGVEPLGVAVALIGAVFASCAFISISHLSHIRPESVTLHFAAFGSTVAFALLLISLPLSLDNLPPAPVHAGGLLLIAVLGSFAQVFLTLGLSRGHTVTMTLIGLTQIVFGGLYDFLLWGHTFSPSKLLGFALIGGCVILMTARRRDS